MSEAPDGRWRAEIRWKDAQGRRRRVQLSEPTEVAAKRGLRTLQAEVSAGRTPGRGRLTVEAYWKVWREGPLRTGDRKDSTIRPYRSVMSEHILPAVGGIRLSALTAGNVERMLAGMVTKRP